MIAIAAVPLPLCAQLSSKWEGRTGNPDVEWKQQVQHCSVLIDSGAETQHNLLIA